MLAAILLLLAAQEDVEIPRRDKQDYFEAVQSCKDVELKLDSDETAAIEKLTAILNNPRIVQVECRIRIQLQADKYTQPYLFVPYQLRGRAELSLAGKTANPAMKKQLLEDAVRDLKASVARGVESSRKPLSAAQAELERLGAPAPPSDSPAASKNAARARADWNRLMGERRFKSAASLLERETEALPEKEKADLLSETRQACASFLTEQMIRFRRNLASVSGIAELRSMSATEFDTTFSLPAPEEILGTYAPYEWARTHRESLRAAGSGKEAVAPLLRMAGDAARLESAGENPWFAMTEALAFQDLRGALEVRVSGSADAARGTRDALLGEARALLESWTGFVRTLDEGVRKRHAFLDAHSKTLADILAKAPRDLEGLDSEDLHSCFEGAGVGTRLQAEEDRLRTLLAEGGLSRESRQQALTLVVAARSIRMFLTGSAEEEVRKAVRDDLAGLSRVGGASNPDRFGPRVRKIFDSLR